MKNKNKEVKKYTDVKDLLLDLLLYKSVINVKSESEAEEFVEVMRDIFDMGWLDDNYCSKYRVYYETTCYDFKKGKNCMDYFDINWYERINVNIIPYSQVRDLLVNGSL